MILTLAGWLLIAAAAAAQETRAEEPGDWPSFLGPDHNGISRETGLLKAWPPEGPPVVWTRELGETYAVPSVVRGALVVFHREGNEEIVERLDPATGRRAWRFSYPTAYVDRFGYNGGPRAAPTIDAGRVYVFGAEAKLHCLDLETGCALWRRSLHEEYFREPRQNFFGAGVAPRMDGDALFLNLGDENAGCVTALDKKTGRTLWRADGDGASYASAAFADAGGTRQVVFLTREGGLGCGAADGEVLWRYPFRARERFSANAASPVVVGDRVLLSASYGVGSALLKLEGRGVRELWRNRALGAHWATPIPLDGHAYGFDGRHEEEAELRCVRLEDGRRMWSRGGYGRGSMIRADGRFIILAEDGRLVLADLSPEGAREISSARVLRPHCWGAPVLSRGLLYVQNFDHSTGRATLLCLNLRAK
jgi:outer membrane protein assembly factor BamB